MSPDFVCCIRKTRCNVTKLLLRIGMSLNPAVYFLFAEPGTFHGLREGENAVLNKRRVVGHSLFLVSLF